MPAAKKQTVTVDERNERVITVSAKDSYSLSSEISLSAKSGKVNFTAPCGEEREFDAAQVSLIDDVLSLLTELTNDPVVAALYDQFNEAGMDAGIF